MPKKYLILLWSLFLFCVTINAQNTRKQYKKIFKNVETNLNKNYDVNVCVYKKYNEFVYNDSSDNFISAISLDNIVENQNEYDPCKPILSDIKRENEKNYILKAESFNHDDDRCGYAHNMIKILGGNFYYNIGSLIFAISLKNNTQYDPKKESPASCSRTFMTSKKIKSQYWVSDSIIKEEEVWILKQKSEYTNYFDKSKFLKKLPPNTSNIQEAINKELAVIGTWNNGTTIHISTTVVNKKDYAILSHVAENIYKNTEGKVFKTKFKNIFSKVGNKYYETLFCGVMPRYSKECKSCGFNNENLYTYFSKESALVTNKEALAREYDFDKKMKVKQSPYSSFCKPLNKPNKEMKKAWEKFKSDTTMFLLN